MAIHPSSENISLDVTLIYNFICLITGTFSDHERNTYEATMIKKGHQNFRHSVMFHGAPSWPLPIKNPAYAPLVFCRLKGRGMAQCFLPLETPLTTKYIDVLDAPQTHTVCLVVESVWSSRRGVRQQASKHTPPGDVVLEVTGYDAQQQVPRSSKTFQRHLPLVLHRCPLPLGQPFFHVDEPVQTNVLRSVLTYEVAAFTNKSRSSRGERNEVSWASATQHSISDVFEVIKSKISNFDNTDNQCLP